MRILIVDDHPLVRVGLRNFLSTEPDFELFEAVDGPDALKQASALQPDVILMDLVMPGMDGVTATAQCLEASPRSKVIILTSVPDDTRVLPAIRAGALSYLLKDVLADDLVKAIRDAAAGKASFHPLAADRMVRALQGDEPPVPGADALTPREMEVLSCIGQGMSNKEIAHALGIGERTVKTHVSNLLAKLDCPDRTNLAIYAWRHGLERPS